VLKGDLYFYSVEHDMRETVSEIDTSRCPLRARARAMREIGHFPKSEDHRGFMGYIGVRTR
jgi:hypothetical protein